MRATLPAGAPDVVARAESLRADVARHKAAIRRHRAELGAARAALDTLEAECRRRGIQVVREAARASR